MTDPIAEIVEALQAHLSSATVVNGFKYPVSAVTCRDGTVFSVQAGAYLYSKPRDNTGPWTHVEVMTITEDVIPRNWEQDAGDQLAGYVPIEAVAREIYERGFVLPTNETLKLE